MVEYLKKKMHKQEVSSEDWHKVHPNLLILAYDFCKWCEQEKLPVTITSIIRGKVATSKTDIHSKGRAFDISVKGWTTNDIDKCHLYIHRMWSDSIGAISLSDKLKRAVVFHGEGENIHGHFQVRT